MSTQSLDQQQQQQQTVTTLTSSIDRCIRPYQAAVALSNMGVTLIERQSYADAVITIRDALYLIRAFADPERDTTIDSVLPTDDDIQSMLHRATNCLLYHSLHIVASSQMTNIKLTTLSDQQSSTLDIFSAVTEADAYLVRIDDTINPVEDYSSAYTVHSKASAILLNYGTACQCLHHVQGGTRSGDNNTETGDVDILREAMLFLEISYRILVRQMEPIMRLLDTNKNLNATEMEVTRTLNLTLLVLQTLINVCCKLGEIDEVLTYRYEFDSVSTTITNVRSAQLWQYMETAPSA